MNIESKEKVIYPDMGTIRICTIIGQVEITYENLDRQIEEFEKEVANWDPEDDFPFQVDFADRYLPSGWTNPTDLNPVEILSFLKHTREIAP